MKWIKSLFLRIKLEIKYRRNLKQARKDDPYIYH